MPSVENNLTNVRNFYDDAARSTASNSLAHRQQTRILRLRNFNNWIKSVFINQYGRKVRMQFGRECRLRVLDLCCGKGGDQMKWAEQDVDHVTFVDISSASIDACRGRYRQLRNRRRYLYSADFHVADCTSALPEEVLRSGPFEVVSCQFAAHYAFESLSQARTLFNNVARCLRPGGFFLATIPNAYEIVRRANEAVHPTKDDIDFGNSIYSIRFQPDICQRTVNSDTCTWGALKFPLFGARYDFQLDGVVDCPEYLVYPPLFEKLAAEHHLLSLTPPIPFSKYFYDTIACTEDRNSYELLIRMGALETWSNPWCTDSDVTKPASSEAEQCKESAYKHVEERIALDDICRHSPSLGTMSDCEWEVVKLYSLVSLQKE